MRYLIIFFLVMHKIIIIIILKGLFMKINKSILSLFYKFVICVVGLFAVLLNCGILFGNIYFKSFTFFTTISNILCISYYIIDIIWLIFHYKQPKITNICPNIKYAFMMNILITFVITQFIFRYSLVFGNSNHLSLFILHYVMPLLVLFDWIMFDTKGYIKIKSTLSWIILPYIYVITCFICANIGLAMGNTNSSYPYFFLDIEKFGISKVFLNIFFLTLLFFFIGMIIYILDDYFKKK